MYIYALVQSWFFFFFLEQLRLYSFGAYGLG